MSIVKSGLVPRLKAPIVLVHGLFGFDRVKMGSLTVTSYFPGVEECFLSAGNRVFTPWLHPTGGIAQRAQELKDFLLLRSPDEPVHILAHSMGGLDSRYMISKLGMAQKVLSLTTLGTPHRGTAFADWAVGKLKSSSVLPSAFSKLTTFADWAIGKLEGVVRPALTLFNVPHQAFDDLTTAHCRKFNEDVPPAPNVRYYSVAGRIDNILLSPEFLLPYPLVLAAEGANDGVVSVASAQYGDEDVEIWKGDHFSLVNWIHPIAENRTIFRDPAPRFGPLLGRLANMGF